MNRQILEILKSPVTQALLGDIVVFQGLDQIKQIVAHQRMARTLNQQQGTATSAQSAAQVPRELHKQLLKLTSDKILEVTEWLRELPRAYKAEIAKWEAGELETLLKLPAHTRTSLIAAVTGPTPAEELAKLKQWFLDQLPTLNDESKAIIKEWEDWADDILTQP